MRLLICFTVFNLALMNSKRYCGGKCVLGQSGHSEGTGMTGPRECIHNRLYDRRKSKPEDGPTFHVKY
jgi:hypothetical protein